MAAECCSSCEYQRTVGYPSTSWASCWKLALTCTPDPIRPTRRRPDPNWPTRLAIFFENWPTGTLLAGRRGQQGRCRFYLHRLTIEYGVRCRIMCMRRHFETGGPETALGWRSLQSIVDGSTGEWHKRLQACVYEKEHFEHLLWYLGCALCG